MNLTQKWNEGELARDDVVDWLISELTSVREVYLTSKEFKHVVRCLYNIYLSDKDGYPVGDFLHAVLSNDFVDAATRADSTNRKVLPEYARFLWNVAPADVAEF